MKKFYYTNNIPKSSKITEEEFNWLCNNFNEAFESITNIKNRFMNDIDGEVFTYMKRKFTDNKFINEKSVLNYLFRARRSNFIYITRYLLKEDRERMINMYESIKKNHLNQPSDDLNFDEMENILLALKAGLKKITDLVNKSEEIRKDMNKVEDLFNNP